MTISIERRSACQSSATVPQWRQNSQNANKEKPQRLRTLLHDSSITATGLALLLLWCQLIAGCHSQPVLMPRIGSNSVDAGAVTERLRTMMSTGTVPAVHSTTLGNDRRNAQKVYEAIQYIPAWVREGQATPQALAIISALENSQQKGLYPEDYEASRWPAQLAALKSASRTAGYSGAI